ncbi:MAG TPA: class I SAM-dependent methyltransferase, partial [Desulfatiglandales bacterium]|nr:class I SAM-dependent methyltransferase [Desulfatiglandales bacterium]
MGFPLLSRNRLERKNPNTLGGESQDNFDYSDGDHTEEYLKDAMIKARDLSSQSLELEEKIVDWVSEYHLSSQRANLLRGLNFEGIRNALELGCGCGAITRYLGELGINVDAVEGNFRRAEITKLRCRDLENVTVTHANFNDLIFPKDGYDAIFLIGVLEYAKRFLPTAEDHKDAAIKIMSLAKSALKAEGLLFVAIENRMGLKYWMGASED